MAESEISRVISIECVAAGRRVPLPVILSDVPAGFPSPADDYIEKNIDLNEWMIDKMCIRDSCKQVAVDFPIAVFLSENE